MNSVRRLREDNMQNQKTAAGARPPALSRRQRDGAAGCFGTRMRAAEADAPKMAEAAKPEPDHRRVHHRLRPQAGAAPRRRTRANAFIDTLGVMLAGSREPASDIVCEMIRLEGSAPAASIVGQSLRTSPQSAALANGVAGHAMDYDFTYFAGQVDFRGHPGDSAARRNDRRHAVRSGGSLHHRRRGGGADFTRESDAGAHRRMALDRRDRHARGRRGGARASSRRRPARSRT